MNEGVPDAMHTVIEDAHASPYDWGMHGLQVAARWSASPSRDELREVLREVDDDGLVVSGSAATLNLVVEALRRTARVGEVPIAFVAGKAKSDDAAKRLQGATLDLVETLGLPGDVGRCLTAPATRLPLARNDIGGVLLVEAVHEGTRASRWRAPSFGAQAYHDDALIADDAVRSISVRPDYATGDLIASVTPTSGRRKITRSTGRAVQIACDPAPMYVDGRDAGEVEGRTWYVDDREYWLLRGAQPPT